MSCLMGSLPRSRLWFPLLPSSLWFGGTDVPTYAESSGRLGRPDRETVALDTSPIDPLPIDLCSRVFLVEAAEVVVAVCEHDVWSARALGEVLRLGEPLEDIRERLPVNEHVLPLRLVGGPAPVVRWSEIFEQRSYRRDWNAEVWNLLDQSQAVCLSDQLSAYLTGSAGGRPRAPFECTHSFSNVGTSARSQTNPPTLRIGWYVLCLDSSRNAAIGTPSMVARAWVL
jgi:hypothetical protein